MNKELARENAKSLFYEKLTLKIPVSATGKEPATHWICSMEVTEEGYQKLSDLIKHSIMARCSAKVLLDELSLKIIK